MLTDFIFSLSFLLALMGLGFISLLVSKTLLNKVFDDIDLLMKQFDINAFHPKKPSFFYLFIKRLFDIIESGLSLIILLPLFLAISIAVKIDSRGPILYKQRRVGKGGKIFHAYKFRTTFIAEEITSDNVWVSEYDARITRVGRFLKKTALDQLPKTLNVFLGNMSFVGITTATEFEYENISQQLKNTILGYKPGLISLWVVSRDRQKYNYTSRLCYDLYYISNLSLKMDFSIMVRSVVMTLGTVASY